MSFDWLSGLAKRHHVDYGLEGGTCVAVWEVIDNISTDWGWIDSWWALEDQNSEGWVDWRQSGTGLSSMNCIRLADYPRSDIGLADL